MKLSFFQLLFLVSIFFFLFFSNFSFFPTFTKFMTSFLQNIKKHNSNQK